MRGILVDWLVDVHLKFKLRDQTLFIAVNLVDRYLAQQTIMRQRLQLLGVCSLFIACKYEEIMTPDLKDFVYICDNSYTKQEILEFEGVIIQTMNFNLSCPSSLIFLEIMQEEWTGKPEELEIDSKSQSWLTRQDHSFILARYILEITLLDLNMLNYLPSYKASSALYLANKILDHWAPLKQDLYDEEELIKCAKEMYQLLINQKNSNLQAIKRKFS